jgi:hypothetical protein
MKKIALLVALFVFPFITHAQRVLDLNSFLIKVNNVMNQIIPIMISFAVVWLIYSVIRYFIATSEPDKKAASSMVFMAIIGLFVILSIWGLVNFLVRTFGLDNNVPKTEIHNLLPTNGGI